MDSLSETRSNDLFRLDLFVKGWRGDFNMYAMVTDFNSEQE